jgi:hypothetical protein
VKINAALRAHESTSYDDRRIRLQISGQGCRAGVDIELVNLRVVDRDVVGEDDIVAGGTRRCSALGRTIVRREC